MKIKCFVGLAIRDEIDFIYQNGIKVALEKSGVIPRRVDKIPHNERIDSKIREEIINSDFMIADLTFERPSVYWEAGFAERAKEVIYTCRNDHLIENSGFKVHFDLINANIIGWDSNKMGDFIDALCTRIQLILEPIKRTNDRESQIIGFRQEFNNFSIKEQQKNLSTIVDNSLDQLGYINCDFLPRYPSILGRAECKFRKIDKALIFIQPCLNYYKNDYLEIVKLEDRFRDDEKAWQIFTFFDFPRPGFIVGNIEDFLMPFKISNENTKIKPTKIDSKFIKGVDSIRKIIIFINNSDFKINELKKRWSSLRKGEFDFHLYDPDIVINYIPTGSEPYISHEILIFEKIKSIHEFSSEFIQCISKIENSESTIDRSIYPDNLMT